jgi:hypothetical protein
MSGIAGTNPVYLVPPRPAQLAYCGSRFRIHRKVPEVTMKVTKQQMLDMLDKVGPRELSDEAARTLPDPVDTERDADLLARYGLEHGHLIERLSGSP